MCRGPEVRECVAPGGTERSPVWLRQLCRLTGGVTKRPERAAGAQSQGTLLTSVDSLPAVLGSY